MYRALTWWLLDRGVDTGDSEAVAVLAAEPVIEVSTDPRAPWTRVDGTDVSQAIRSREVTSAVSAVAAVPQVRAHLIADAAGDHRDAPGIVAEGRDIGTVVAPDAPVKVFLTADGAARASRRAAEASWSPATTRAEQDRRDRLDAAQSGKAADAVEIDSTGLGLDRGGRHHRRPGLRARGDTLPAPEEQVIGNDAERGRTIPARVPPPFPWSPWSAAPTWASPRW